MTLDRVSLHACDLPDDRLAHPAARICRGYGVLHRLRRAAVFSRQAGAFPRISTLWTEIFSITFAMGVVPGIIMPLRFGTGLSGLSRATRNITFSSLAYEGLIEPTNLHDIELGAVTGFQVGSHQAPAEKRQPAGEPTP